ncbi:MAG TPA: hypothetical protein VK132_11390, partial [Gemmatimonadales bacterium]|nr:hypothetical protein [Gemmatimonadales bacterium]
MPRNVERVLIIVTLVGSLGFLAQQHWPASATAAGSAIDGTVGLSGTPPPNALIRMGADPNCLQANAGKRATQDAVVVNPNGTLKNVFVHLTGSVPGPSSAPAQPIVIEQNGCVYHPR